MIRTAIHIVLLILANALVRNDVESDNSDVEKYILYKIDISNDSIIQEILRDAIHQEDQCDSFHTYYFGLGKLNNGTLINICEYKDSILDYNMYPHGFLQIEGHTVIVKGDGSYKLKGAKPEAAISVLKRKNRHSIDSKLANMTYYYIMDDIWAKFCPSQGWIWSDGKPDK